MDKDLFSYIRMKSESLKICRNGQTQVLHLMVIGHSFAAHFHYFFCKTVSDSEDKNKNNNATKVPGKVLNNSLVGSLASWLEKV